MTTQKNSEEAALQYNAQVDVISQLAAKVDRQLSTQKKAEKNPTVKTSLIKLERDFNLVKDRVSSLQESATKLRRQSAALQQQERQAAGVLADSNKTEESMGYEEFQRHMELQLQQDVSEVRECGAVLPKDEDLTNRVAMLVFVVVHRERMNKLCVNAKKKSEILIRVCTR